MTDARTPAVGDPRTLKAVAHPLRLRLYELLQTGGPMTGGALAQAIGVATGSISYHLRQLVEYGYVEEVAGHSADRRQRWFRAVPGGIRFSAADFVDSVGGRAAVDAAQQVVLARQIQRLLGFQQRWEDLSAEWLDALHAGDMHLELSSHELKCMNAELVDVIRKWAEHTKLPITEERKPIFVLLHSFPYDPTGTAQAESLPDPSSDSSSGSSSDPNPPPHI